jgi:hypothetical protein
MKAFATKAELIADAPDEGYKTYAIEWIDKHGNPRKDTAQGADMSEALRSVLRQELRHKLEELPMWVYMLAVMLIISAWSLVAFISQAPLVTIMGTVFGFAALYQWVEKYFKYTK